MANNPHLSDISANAAANAIGALANSGKLDIYAGTQPSNANGTATTLLASLTMAATAFGAASASVITAGTITSATAGATGTAAWFRLWESNGTSALFDGSAATATADMILNTTSIVSGATVSVSSLTYTQTE